MFAPLLLVSVLLALAPFPATQMENFGIQLRDGLQAFTSGDPHADSCFEKTIHSKIDTCVKEAITKHPFSAVSPDKVDEKAFEKMKTSGCAARKESIECINKAACTGCKYEGAKALKYWYQQQDKELATDCPGKTLVKACQDNLKPSVNPNGPGNNGTKTTTSKSSTTLIIVIVVVVIVLIVLAVAVYCLFCKKDASKASKESGGAKSSAPKSARPSQVASSPMGVKSSALAVGKSAVKSSLAGGGAKSAAKSSAAGGAKSQAKSAAGLKANSKAKSKA